MDNSYLVKRKRLYDSLAACSNDKDFWTLATQVYEFQTKYNPIFKEFVGLIHKSQIENELNFLPISFFKLQRVVTGSWDEEVIFSSSGTTGMTRSTHYLHDLQFYLSNTVSIFQTYYGPVEEYCFLCLLPSYLERKGSSLIAMCDHFIKKSDDPRSEFYLYNHEKLYATLEKLKKENKKTILLGVSYGLLDFAERFQIDGWENLIVMKTGGMKGKRGEMNKSELDAILKSSFGIRQIHGEYGMTECLSQLYSSEDDRYILNNRMKVVLTDLSDPLSVIQGIGKSGRINIIDLANIDSCAFISTDDIGMIDKNGKLNVLGRIDNSDLRGCNLLL